MQLTIKIPEDVGDVIPDKRTLVEAGAAGISDLVVEHLRARNQSAKHAPGMPRSNYWSEAADSVQTEMNGDVGTVSVSKEGVAIHYYGGVILPTGGKKALAFPVNPAVAGMRAAEYDPTQEKLDFVPGQKGRAPTLRDKETGEVYYVLITRQKFQPDPSVLPSESAMYAAAMGAMQSVKELL